ncbi:hypothetical protein Tco_0505280 [Tanacetum coccineum]
MAYHSQKWYDGSSSRNINSSSNTEGIVAIVKLDSLGRDMKKLKENVHAIQVGCQTCMGAHLDEECSLNEEVKSMEEVKYGEFGMGKLELINMVIEMADNTKCTPKGIVKNLLVKIDKFIFLVDFVVLDMVEDFRMPIILGRLLLATTHAKDNLKMEMEMEIPST